MLAALLLLVAAACSASAPEERLAEGDEAVPPPATGGTASPGATAPRPPGRRPPPAEVGTGADAPTAPGGPTLCTQIGCSDGLHVELDGFDEEVELELVAGDETRTVTCLPPGPCRHFVPDFTPAEVTAIAFFPDREEERSFEPEYREERPNGRDCPPVCRQARIRWKL
ncbi:MAG TPA: hypothetical protein VF100_04380 [Thermoanaerobaculia bacterium]